MEQSANHIRHISHQQPNEKLQKLVEDYQLSNRRYTIHLDNDVTLPWPDEEQKKTHVRQRSITKRKRTTMYQDYSNNLSLDPNVNDRRTAFASSTSSDRYRHCWPVHTKFRSSLLKSFDIDSDLLEIREEHREDNDCVDDEVDDCTDKSGKTQMTVVKVPQRDVLSFVGIRNLVFLTALLTNFRASLHLAGRLSLASAKYYLNHYLLQNEDLIYIWISAGLSFVSLFTAFLIEKVAISTVSPSSKFHRLINLSHAAKTIKKKRSITNIRARPIIDLATINRLSTIVFFLHLTNILAFLVVTNSIVYVAVYNCLIGSAITIHSVILSFKLTSYYLTNRELRDLYTRSLNQKTLSSSSSFIDGKSTDSGNNNLVFLPTYYQSCQYPTNISFTNICQLWMLPTLVYQPVYPIDSERTTNYRYIFYKGGEILAATAGAIHLNNHYAVPSFEKLLSLLMFEGDLSSTTRYLQIIEILANLATISISIWFLGYYSFFHNYLNILAEFTKFGDKNFYYNWWNSDSVLAYWTRWNKPLNSFLKRHVIPATGNSVKSASLILLSLAVFSELIVGIPTHNFLGLAFFSTVLQIPLIYLTETLSPATDEYSKPSFTGSVIFWCSFFIGQPLCFLFYYLSWCAKNSYVNEHAFRR